MVRQLTAKEQRALEICLIIVSLGVACLFYEVEGYKMAVLHLFYLPIVLTGFYLGLYRAGVLTLFCVILASIVAVLSIDSLAAYTSPLVMALAVAVWGSSAGLTALLVGTLSDERTQKTCELHDAYVGVVEVMSQYLQSAHPRLKARSSRVAELCCKVATALKLSPKDIDDVRIAALLYDTGNVEVTAKVIRRALGTLEEGSIRGEHTFQGRDLVLSLGSVLHGAMPMLLNQDEVMPGATAPDAMGNREVPIGAKIIRLVRDFDTLTNGENGEVAIDVEIALAELKADTSSAHDPRVVQALKSCLELPPAARLAAEPQPVA